MFIVCVSLNPIAVSTKKLIPFLFPLYALQNLLIELIPIPSSNPLGFAITVDMVNLQSTNVLESALLTLITKSLIRVELTFEAVFILAHCLLTSKIGILFIVFPLVCTNPCFVF